MGRGVLSQRIPLPRKNYQGADDCPSGIVFVNCTNVLVEGIVQTRAYVNWSTYTHCCDSVTLRDLHVLGPVAVSTDGFNPANTRNVIVDRCFFRVNDDCMSIGAISGGGVPLNECPPTENISVSNTVFWNNQNGRALVLGLGRAKDFRNIKVQDCDVLWNGSPSTPTFAISTEVGDVLFENIRVEYARNCLFQIGLVNEWGGRDHQSDPRFTRGVTFRNISVLQHAARSSIFEGSSADKPVQDVTIENLRYGDEVIRDAQAMGLKTNAWVRNLRIVAPEGK
jgi:hypothetical protein